MKSTINDLDTLLILIIVLFFSAVWKCSFTVMTATLVGVTFVATTTKNSSFTEVTYLCHKLYSACISITSGPIFTNQVVLESPKWGLSAHIWDVQKQQQTTKISDH